jgi:hypothetical protein
MCESQARDNITNGSRMLRSDSPGSQSHGCSGGLRGRSAYSRYAASIDSLAYNQASDPPISKIVGAKVWRSRVIVRPRE